MDSNYNWSCSECLLAQSAEEEALQVEDWHLPEEIQDTLSGYIQTAGCWNRFAPEQG